MSSGFFSRMEQGLNQKLKCRVAVPMAQDEACAYAVCRGMKEGLVAPILIGDVKEISKLYNDAARDSLTSIIEEKDPDKASKIAVSLVRDGRADILMKGLLPTSTLLKAVLNSQDGIKKNSLLSHLCFFESAKFKGMKILSDAGINIAPNTDELVKIAQNAVEAWRLFSDKDPNVALLSANEKVSEKVPSTVLAKAAAELLVKDSRLRVAGPISLDLAISPESVKIKKYEGPVQGNADLFVVPRIEVGNVFYKSLQYFAGAQMGGVVYGAKCPVVLTSRSDSNDTKYNSLVLGIFLWNRAMASGKEAVQ